jgi:glycosyltransferase involved in cell wall biosynthesis
MKCILVAPGFKPFPPKGWGAVESIVWDYYENLKKRGYDIYIVNKSNLNQMIEEINRQSPSIVHIMYDDYIVIVPYLQCKKIYYTSHYAYITNPQFEKKYSSYFHNIFKKVVKYSSFITVNAISEEIKKVYINHGFPEKKINVICNGAREDLFRFSLTPKKSDRSIYIAKIELRKSQYKYQNIQDIDFVGNYHNSNFDIKRSNYLGEWDKPTLYENLTDYGNLVLLSEGEADSLVIKEALISGLGLVISDCCSANLDLNKPFITVISNDKINDLNYISNEIEKNRVISIQMRKEIREYGLEYFSWDHIIEKYCHLCLQ